MLVRIIKWLVGGTVGGLAAQGDLKRWKQDKQSIQWYNGETTSKCEIDSCVLI